MNLPKLNRNSIFLILLILVLSGCSGVRESVSEGVDQVMDSFGYVKKGKKESKTPTGSIQTQKPLGKEEILRAQKLLDQKGYQVGEIDGIMGPQTRRAIRSFQKSEGLPEDGLITLALLERLENSPNQEKSNTPSPSPPNPQLASVPDPIPATNTGLGISLDSIKSVFSNNKYELNITPASSANGESKFLGTTEDKEISVQLIGPSENLKHASISLLFSEEKREVAMNHSGIFIDLLKQTNPKWEDADNWINQSLPKAVDGEKIRTTKDGREISIVYGGFSPILVFTVKSVR